MNINSIDVPDGRIPFPVLRFPFDIVKTEEVDSSSLRVNVNSTTCDVPPVTINMKSEEIVTVQYLKTIKKEPKTEDESGPCIGTIVKTETLSPVQPQAISQNAQVESISTSAGAGQTLGVTCEREADGESMQPVKQELSKGVLEQENGEHKLDSQITKSQSKSSLMRRSTRNNIRIDYAVLNEGMIHESPQTSEIHAKNQKVSGCINPKWRFKMKREGKVNTKQANIADNILDKDEEFNSELFSVVKVEREDMDLTDQRDAVNSLDESDMSTQNVQGGLNNRISDSQGWNADRFSNGMVLVNILSSNIKIKAEIGLEDESSGPVFSLTSNVEIDDVKSEELVSELVGGQTVAEQIAILKSRVDLSDQSTLSYWDGYKNHTCLICGHKTHVPSNMVKHLRTHTGEKPYICTECDYRCVESSGLRSHMRTHTGEKPHVCPYCDFQTRQSMSLKNHIMTHLGQKPLKCPSCDYRCIERGSLKVHLRTHSGEKPYACPHCDYRGIKSSSLKSHMRVHTGDKPYQCSYCGFTCSCASSLKLHLRKHTGEKPYSCQFCDFRSSSSSQLKVHVRRHTGEKPYLCKECGYRSATNGRYVAHLRIHSGEKNHACPYCDYRSARSDNLKVHLRTHTGERPYPCPHCEYRSTEKARLVAHIRVHTGEKPFVCKICGFSSADGTGLRSHMKTHSSEKPYSCPHCSFRTARGGILKNHIMRHTGVKPYACPYCPYKSKKSCSLKIHVANHTGDKKFKCPEPGCEFRACVPSGLRGHIGTHLKEKNFKCDLCPYRGKQQLNLRAHYRQSHSSQPFAPSYSCYHCTFNTHSRQLMKLHAIEHLS